MVLLVYLLRVEEFDSKCVYVVDLENLGVI